jgi:hypothetical protein
MKDLSGLSIADEDEGWLLLSDEDGGGVPPTLSVQYSRIIVKLQFLPDSAAARALPSGLHVWLRCWLQCCIESCTPRHVYSQCDNPVEFMSLHLCRPPGRTLFLDLKTIDAHTVVEFTAAAAAPSPSPPPPHPINFPVPPPSPPSQAILGEVGRFYVPFMLANARAIERGEGTVDALLDGEKVRWSQPSFKYQVAKSHTEIDKSTNHECMQLNGQTLARLY